MGEKFEGKMIKIPKHRMGRCIYRLVSTGLILVVGHIYCLKRRI